MSRSGTWTPGRSRWAIMGEVRFCWECGHLLRGKPGGGFYFAEVDMYRNKCRVHKQCKKKTEEAVEDIMHEKNAWFDHNPEGSH